MTLSVIDLAIVFCVVVFVLIMLWRIASGLAAILIQLERANRYLQQICWRADQQHGDLPEHWRDPGKS